MSWSKRNFRALSLVTIGLAMLPAYLRAYVLAGPSDIPTVLLGDKVIVNHAAFGLKLPYSDVRAFRTGSPARGDFVLLRLSNHPRLKSPFFKRIIGLPGESVEVRENQVMVDGRKLSLKSDQFNFERKNTLYSATIETTARTHARLGRSMKTRSSAKSSPCSPLVQESDRTLDVVFVPVNWYGSGPRTGGALGRNRAVPFAVSVDL